MTDAELERARLVRKQNKRSVLAGALDPFRLWGARGYIGRYFVRRDEDDVSGGEVGRQAQVVKTEKDCV